jgi:hypothetical protein
MKKLTRTTKPAEHAPIVLTQRDLSAVIGGTGGTIIVQNATGGQVISEK